MMGKWMDIRVKTEVSKFNAVRSKIEGWPKEVAQDIYFPALEQIAKDGVDFMRFIIISATTMTGAQRAAAGGNGPGRVDSGKMYDKVNYRARKRAKNGFSLFVGWVDGQPGYAIFQENGTKNGVIGMEALRQTQEYMYAEVVKLANGGRVNKTKTGL